MRNARAARLILVTMMLTLPAPARGQARETAGVITEIKVASGKAEVRSSGGAWRRALPLQALRPGDEVRASDGASLVVLLSGGRGTMRIEAANSPFAVMAQAADDSKLQKAATLVGGSMKFLTTGPKETPKAVLATRSMARPPEILTPRNGPVLPGPLVVEWLGNQLSRYTLRILGPTGVVLERKGVSGTRFEYPADAPALDAGVPYRVQVTALNQAPREAGFEIADAARARGVQAELKDLEAGLGTGATPTSIAVARAGYLAGAGLLHDARLTVLAALARDPDEPVLHTLLGNLYLQTGLREQAAESLDEADFLLTRR